MLQVFGNADPLRPGGTYDLFRLSSGLIRFFILLFRKTGVLVRFLGALFHLGNILPQLGSTAATVQNGPQVAHHILLTHCSAADAVGSPVGL